MHPTGFGRVCSFAVGRGLVWRVFVWLRVERVLSGRIWWMHSSRRVGRSACSMTSARVSGRTCREHGDIEIIEGSVADPTAVTRAVAGCDVVYHLAALASVAKSVEDPATSHAVCATGTLNVLDAARKNGVRRVVYAASASAYGGASDPEGQDEDTPLVPFALRGGQADRRVLLRSVRQHLRPRNGTAALLQRLRPASACR